MIKAKIVSVFLSLNDLLSAACCIIFSVVGALQQEQRGVWVILLSIALCTFNRKNMISTCYLFRVNRVYLRIDASSSSTSPCYCDSFSISFSSLCCLMFITNGSEVVVYGHELASYCLQYSVGHFGTPLLWMGSHCVLQLGTIIHHLALCNFICASIVFHY